MQISQNSSIYVTNGNTAHNGINTSKSDVSINETESTALPLDKDIMSTDFTNKSNLDLFYSIPEDKPSLNFKPMRETLLHSYDTILDGKYLLGTCKFLQAKQANWNDHNDQSNLSPKILYSSEWIKFKLMLP